MDSLVERIVATDLRAADAAVPGLIEGLYLVGSVALGDFRPSSSDIDFVAVTANPLEGASLPALGQLRKQSHPRLDGIYVTWEDLARLPSEVVPGASSCDGEFERGASDPPSPVMWHTLARYGVVCRGPRPTDFNIASDARILASWTDNNPDQYWARLLDHASRWRGR